MATSGAAAVAAAAARARREVRDRFEEGSAFDPERALSYDPPGHLHARQLRLLLDQGILRETSDGRFWMDQDAVQKEIADRRSALKIVFVIIIAGVLVAITIAAFQAP